MRAKLKIINDYDGKELCINVFQKMQQGEGFPRRKTTKPWFWAIWGGGGGEGKALKTLVFSLVLLLFVQPLFFKRTRRQGEGSKDAKPLNHDFEQCWVAHSGGQSIETTSVFIGFAACLCSPWTPWTLEPLMKPWTPWTLEPLEPLEPIEPFNLWTPWTFEPLEP